MGLDLATLAQAFGAGTGGYLQGRSERRRVEEEKAEREAERKREQERWQQEQQQQETAAELQRRLTESTIRGREQEQERYETGRAEERLATGSKVQAAEAAAMRGARNEQERQQIQADLSKLPDDQAGLAYLTQVLGAQEEARKQAGVERVAGLRVAADKPTREDRVRAFAERLVLSGDYDDNEAVTVANQMIAQVENEEMLRAVREKVAGGGRLTPDEEAIAREEGLLPTLGPTRRPPPAGQPSGAMDVFNQAIIGLQGARLPAPAPAPPADPAQAAMVRLRSPRDTLRGVEGR